MRSIHSLAAESAPVKNRSHFESFYVNYGAIRTLVLLFESTQIDHSMDKGAVFIVKCLQAFCIVMAAVIGSFSDRPGTLLILWIKLVGEHRIKIRADVRVIAFRIFEEQFLTIIEDGKMYEMLGIH